MHRAPSQSEATFNSTTSVAGMKGQYTGPFYSVCRALLISPRKNSAAIFLFGVHFLQFFSLILNLNIDPWLSEKYFPDIRTYMNVLLPYWTAQSVQIVVLLVGGSLICLSLLALLLLNLNHHKQSTSQLRLPRSMRVIAFVFRLFQIPIAAVTLVTLSCVPSTSDQAFYPLTSIGGCWSWSFASLRLVAGILLLLLLLLSYVFDHLTRDTNLVSKFIFSQNYVNFSYFYVYLSKIAILAIFYLLPHRPFFFLCSFILSPVVLFLYLFRTSPYLYSKAVKIFGFVLGLWFAVGTSYAAFQVFNILNIDLSGVVVTLVFLLPAIISSILCSRILSISFRNSVSLVFPDQTISSTEQKLFGNAEDQSNSSDSEGSNHQSVANVDVPVNSWYQALRYTAFVRPYTKKQSAVEKGRSILEFYSSKFPETVELFLQRSAFDLYHVHDSLGANVILSQLKRLDVDLSFDQEFRMSFLEVQIDNLRRHQNTGLGDSDQYVQLQRSIRDAEEKLGEYLHSVFKFWTYLKKGRVQIDVLPKLTEEIKDKKLRVESVYNRLLNTYPESPEVMRTYATFSRDVLGDEELAASFTDRADLLSTPSSNDHGSSSLRSASVSGSIAAGKKASKKKRSKLQLLQSDLLTVSKSNEKGSSIEGFANGIKMAFIIIFVCALFSLISTEVSLNSVSNRILGLIESSHISLQSALLPLNLRQLYYSVENGIDSSQLNTFTIQTSQHLNYHFSRLTLGESYNSDVFQCPRTGTSPITAVDDMAVTSLITSPRIFVKLFRSSAPPVTGNKGYESMVVSFITHSISSCSCQKYRDQRLF
ncbi:hypothetical protein GEMRC1_011297 [Eukaryota sp. GEM-RC1]